MTSDVLLLNLINVINELNFKFGGVCIPKFKSLDEVSRFNEFVSETFPTTNKKFSDAHDKLDIKYDIQPRFLSNDY